MYFPAQSRKEIKVLRVNAVWIVFLVGIESPRTQFSIKYAGLIIHELTRTEVTLARGSNDCMRVVLHVQFLSGLTPSVLSGFMVSCHFVT